MENLKKKSGKNKNKLRAISPKNHENFENSKPRVVLVVLIKKSVPRGEEGNHNSVIQGLLYRSGDATCFFYFQSESPFVYKVIIKTKLSMTTSQKQNPQNIKESLSLNTICTYNTSYIFFVLFNHLFIIIFVGFASIT